MQRDSVTKERFQARLQSGTQFFHTGDQRQRGAEGTIGGVRLRVGRAPVAQELVPQKMFHAAVFSENGARLDFEDPVEKLKHPRWAEKFRDRSRVPKVGQ